MENLCMGCITPKDYDGVCKKCGYSENSVYLMSYLAPKTILKERYVVGKLLSYNGEGAYYIGFDKEQEKRIAIKEYMPDALCTREENSAAVIVNSSQMALYKTYMSEFIDLNRSLMNAGDLECIQNVLDIFYENNTAYSIVEYIEGISLKSYVDNYGGTLSWEQISELFPSLFTTLGILHNMGIVHRGLCPSTIYINNKNKLKLIGFGITASRTADSELNYEVFGGYAAPEQYSGNERQGSTTDIYGICAVLYKVLTGIIPPDAVSRIKEDSLSEPVMIKRNIPVNVSRVIKKGLSLHREDRLQNINEFVDRLFETPNYLLKHSGVLEPIEEKAALDADKGVPVEIDLKAKMTAPKRKPIQKKKKIPQSAVIGIIAVGVIAVIFILMIIFAVLKPPVDSEEEEITTTTETFDEAVTETSVTSEKEPEQTTEALPDIMYTLPDLTNRKYELIKDNPKYAFLIINATYEFNEDFASGFIFEQDIEGNTAVKEGTEVNIKVSKGPEKVALPTYIGKTTEKYKEELSALGIKFEVKKKRTNEAKAGNVLECSKEEGELINVANGEVVVVYSAEKPKEKEETNETTVSEE